MKPGLEVGQGQYRVILVHLPDDPDPLFEALPVAGTLHEDDLPLALRITDDRHQALQTAERMRELGAQVVIGDKTLTWKNNNELCRPKDGDVWTYTNPNGFGWVPLKGSLLGALGKVRAPPDPVGTQWMQSMCQSFDRCSPPPPNVTET